MNYLYYSIIETRYKDVYQEIVISRDQSSLSEYKNINLMDIKLSRTIYNKIDKPKKAYLKIKNNKIYFNFSDLKILWKVKIPKERIYYSFTKKNISNMGVEVEIENNRINFKELIRLDRDVYVRILKNYSVVLNDSINF